MKFYCLLVAVIFFTLSGSLQAQNERKFCITDEMQEEAYRQHPEFLDVKQQLDDFSKQWVKNHAGVQNRTTGAINYIIPVVFHVLHQYGPENISDAQIVDQLRIWNEDFQKRNADTVDVINYFKPIIADCGMEFRLATIDPNGNCTNGIDRIVTPLTYSAADSSKLNYWPGNMYMNVWLCASLKNARAAAYAYYPGTAPAKRDGVMSLSNYIGSIGTGTYVQARTMTHETGHYFNLPHTWGNSNYPDSLSNCNIDDGVSDTPNTIGWLTCPANLNQSTCVGQGNPVHQPGVPDNIQNYMEYSYCNRMFTNGQRDEKMIPALNNPAFYLYNLWQPANLLATGTADPYDYNVRPLCAPNADFTSNKQMICMGDSIKFTDKSWNGQPTSWNWTFPGGIPATATASTVYVQYSTPGTYSVNLTVYNSEGIATFTKNAGVFVVDPTPQAIPASEGFENPSFPPSGAVVLNPDNETKWERTTSASAGGNACMKIANSANTVSQVDEFITPAYDFTGIIPSVTFDLAYAQRDTDTTRMDALKVYYSLNCGQSWNIRYNKTGSELATTTKKPTGWAPNSGEWRNDTLPSISAVLKNRPNVRFKFQSVSGAGNDIYIDNINIKIDPVGIADINSPVSSFDVYPNPAKGVINISVTLEKASDLRIGLYDITGRKISDVADKKNAAGMQNFQISQRLQDGVYFVRMMNGNSIISKRIVVLD